MPRAKGGSIPPPRVLIPPGHGGPIAELNVHDVLSGRGSRVNNYPGNVAFRTILEGYKKEYLDPRTRKLEKAHVAARLVAQIRSTRPSGRFLREDPQNRGKYVEIGDQKAWKKAGQAMREDVPDVRKEIGEDLSQEKQGPLLHAAPPLMQQQLPAYQQQAYQQQQQQPAYQQQQQQPQQQPPQPQYNHRSGVPPGIPPSVSYSPTASRRMSQTEKQIQLQKAIESTYSQLAIFQRMKTDLKRKRRRISSSDHPKSKKKRITVDQDIRIKSQLIKQYRKTLQIHIRNLTEVNGKDNLASDEDTDSDESCV